MPRVPVVVAKTEFRRTIRAVSNERTKLLMMAALAVFMLGSVVVAGGYLLPELGAQVAESVSPSEADLATDLVTGGVAVGWLFLVFMVGIRTFTAAATVDKPAFLLTSTSLRNTVIGVIGAEILLFATWLVPPAILLSSAFASGAGTILPVPLTLVVVALALITAVPVGFVIGVWVRHLVTVYEPIARYRMVIFVGFWVLYFGAIATGRFNVVMGELFTALQGSPLGWPGHLLLAGVPNVPASSATIVGAIVGGAVLGTVATAIGIASARVHWFADPARFDDAEESTEQESSDRLSGVLSRGLSRPIRTVTVTAIRRTKRAPIRLVYVGYPLLGAIGFVQGIVQSGTVPSYVAVLLSLYVVWAAGALFTLNPLGDLGRALPAVVTSTLTGRQAINGLVIAGALVAVPIALLVSLVLGVISPLSLEQTAALVAGTVVGAVVTPALATGIGSVFPRFGSVNVTNNREAVMPSKTAFIVYSLAIMLPTAAAVVLYTDSPELLAELIATISAWTPGPELSVSARGITVAAWTVLVVGLAAPPASYQYAAEQFDWYTLE
ncbi:hypothetical protein GS429_21025 [Natronorubrum sp. JWXQ-INN-674]|uniref:ABC-2 type transport system permease protein n=1 Tax=Natronorubrum halalkaliphilum TaxID=2691917 RepID=A0A6B0VSJ1_9EURY|nr:hypothetical protein [Natronorubrum halalkaliphilum]MXV64508.1 hypothetical protein [Natronorubrum halalkaliphilum]